MKRLRLISVIVQPRFVVDDGEQLEPLDHPPVTIPATEWPTYSSERFPAEVAAGEIRLNESDAVAEVIRDRPAR